MNNQKAKTQILRRSKRFLSKVKESSEKIKTEEIEEALSENQIIMAQNYSVSNSGDANKPEEPPQKKLKNNSDLKVTDDDVFVKIEDIEAEPVESLTPVTVATPAPNGFEISKIPIGPIRQVVPMEGYLLSLQEPFEAPGKNLQRGTNYSESCMEHSVISRVR